MLLASVALWSPTASGIPIGTIQGPGHRSSLEGRKVPEVPGVVTGIREAAGRHGFWMEAPEEDDDPATSQGIFVRTGELPPQVASGDRVTVTGRVREAEPRGGGLPITILEVEALVDIRRGERSATLPAPVVLGSAGRSVPAGVIEDDGMESFDPATDALDFWESLEGMRVRIPEALVIGATTGYGGLSLLPEGGREAEGPRTLRGGLLLEPGDPNPERIQAVVDPASEAPLLGTGDRLRGSVTGIVTYAFGTYQVRLDREDPFRIRRTEKKRDATNLLREDDGMTVATYNVLNLSAADGEERFRRLASSVVRDLGAPDVVALQEIQDDSGPADDGTVRAEETLDLLVAAIREAGGPSYRWLQIDPVDNADGGRPGGNIRVAYLVDPSRVEVPDRRPGDARTAVGLEEARDGTVHPDRNPGRIEPGHRCFGALESEGGSRKPLVLEARFQGSSVFFVNLHLSSKGGDDPLFGGTQPPVRHTEPRRLCQARVVAGFVEGLLRREPEARVVVLGDFNEFEFRAPMEPFRKVGLVNLTLRIPPEERYSYVYRGNSQILDQIWVSPALADGAGIDAVHVNADFPHTEAVSDHDPLVARLVVGDERLTQAEESSELAITYVANEGVLLVADGARVLVDGLHRRYKPAYLHPDPLLLEKLERARPPFDEIDLVLVTHVHRDHFHPDSVGRHLRHNPEARLFTSRQVADRVRARFGAESGLLDRVIGISPAWRERVRRTFDGIEVEALGLHHGSERFRGITNLGYLVHLGGLTVLHVGDAEMSEENFESFDLEDREIDVALVPYWFLTTGKGRRLVEEEIRPDHLVAIHVDPREAEEVVEKIRGIYPDATVFTTSMEATSY